MKFFVGFLNVSKEMYKYFLFFLLIKLILDENKR